MEAKTIRNATTDAIFCSYDSSVTSIKRKYQLGVELEKPGPTDVQRATNGELN